MEPHEYAESSRWPCLIFAAVICAVALLSFGVRNAAATDPATLYCSLSGGGSPWDAGGYDNSIGTTQPLSGSADGFCYDQSGRTSHHFTFSGSITSYGCNATPPASASGTLTIDSSSYAFTWTPDAAQPGTREGPTKGTLTVGETQVGSLSFNYYYELPGQHFNSCASNAKWGGTQSISASFSLDLASTPAASTEPDTGNGPASRPDNSTLDQADSAVGGNETVDSTVDGNADLVAARNCNSGGTYRIYICGKLLHPSKDYFSGSTSRKTYSSQHKPNDAFGSTGLQTLSHHTYRIKNGYGYVEADSSSNPPRTRAFCGNGLRDLYYRAVCDYNRYTG